MGEPAVTVLMSVYNGEQYLREAVESILAQGFTDFEFLIVNDASTDRSFEIISTYRDPRIRVAHNEENIGLAASLNKGIDLARGKYIARMDCDDISLPERFSRQVEFMDTHPGVGVCGTWARIIDSKGMITGKLRPYPGFTARKICWRPSPFLHPTCMIKRDLLKTNKYNPAYQQAQDYELWLRLFGKTDFYNLDKFLYLYRSHGASVSNLKRTQQLSISYKAFAEFIGNEEIDYEGFLSLIPEEAKINPLRRARYWLLASARTGFDAKLFLIDNLVYMKLWLANRWM